MSWDAIVAECSKEIKFTNGLGLIPGTIEPITGQRQHIGWNSIEVIRKDNIFKLSDNEPIFLTIHIVTKDQRNLYLLPAGSIKKKTQ